MCCQVTLAPMTAGLKGSSSRDGLGMRFFYYDPLYSYFLAVLYKVVGRDFFWIYTIQAFLGAWTALLLVLLGNRIGSSIG